MSILDWLILAVIAAAIVTAIRIWRRSGSCACGSRCEGSCASCRKDRRRVKK